MFEIALFPTYTGPFDLSPSWQIDLPQSENFLVIQVSSHRLVWNIFNLISAGETEFEDSITLKAGNPGITTLTNDQARQMLQKADFEGHGFQKEESRSLLSANSSAYMTNVFYYKKVSCSQSQVMKVLTEAEKLLPGN